MCVMAADASILWYRGQRTGFGGLGPRDWIQAFMVSVNHPLSHLSSPIQHSYIYRIICQMKIKIHSSWSRGWVGRLYAQHSGGWGRSMSRAAQVNSETLSHWLQESGFLSKCLPQMHKALGPQHHQKLRGWPEEEIALCSWQSEFTKFWELLGKLSKYGDICKMLNLYEWMYVCMCAYEWMFMPQHACGGQRTT